MRPQDVPLIVLAGLLAVFLVPHLIWHNWQEFCVACGSAALLSWLAARPKRYRPSTQKPWRLVSPRRP